jgi:hypothetical protein
MPVDIWSDAHNLFEIVPSTHVSGLAAGTLDDLRMDEVG